jgi:hypothetical protein
MKSESLREIVQQSRVAQLREALLQIALKMSYPTLIEIAKEEGFTPEEFDALDELLEVICN